MSSVMRSKTPSNHNRINGPKRGKKGIKKGLRNAHIIGVIKSQLILSYRRSWRAYVVGSKMIVNRFWYLRKWSQFSRYVKNRNKGREKSIKPNQTKSTNNQLPSELWPNLWNSFTRALSSSSGSKAITRLFIPLKRHSSIVKWTLNNSTGLVE